MSLIVEKIRKNDAFDSRRTAALRSANARAPVPVPARAVISPPLVVQVCRVSAGVFHRVVLI